MAFIIFFLLILLRQMFVALGSLSVMRDKEKTQLANYSTVNPLVIHTGTRV